MGGATGMGKWEGLEVRGGTLGVATAYSPVVMHNMTL